MRRRQLASACPRKFKDQNSASRAVVSLQSKVLIEAEAAKRARNDRGRSRLPDQQKESADGKKRSLRPHHHTCRPGFGDRSDVLGHRGDERWASGGANNITSHHDYGIDKSEAERDASAWQLTAVKGRRRRTN
jgi:hypothetical protein